MIVYKVVRPSPCKSLKSAVLYKSWLSVNYKVGKFVRAPKEAAKRGYHLTAFKTYQDALNFGPACRKNYKIYKADGREPISQLPSMCDIYKLKYNKIFLKDFIHTFFWPKGTLMFKKIKLLEEVKYE